LDQLLRDTRLQKFEGVLVILAAPRPAIPRKAANSDHSGAVKAMDRVRPFFPNTQSGRSPLAGARCAKAARKPPKLAIRRHTPAMSTQVTRVPMSLSGRHSMPPKCATNSCCAPGNRTWEIAACLLLLASIGFELRTDSGIRTPLADSRIALPRDFDFLIPEGETMESTLRSFIAGSRKVPDPLEGYEPDRTLALLYRLTQLHPIVSSRDLVAACDGHGWSIPARNLG
jgi:hypothetical protein